MTLVKINRNLRDNLFPGFHSPFYGNILNEFLDRPLNQMLGNNSFPPVNIIEDEAFYEIHMASPGHKKEDFNILLEKDVLSISLEEKENEENTKYTRQEYGFQAFKRTFTIPANADLGTIQAEYQEGILKVKINKKAEEKPELKKVVIN